MVQEVIFGELGWIFQFNFWCNYSLFKFLEFLVQLGGCISNFPKILLIGTQPILAVLRTTRTVTLRPSHLFVATVVDLRNGPKMWLGSCKKILLMFFHCHFGLGPLTKSQHLSTSWRSFECPGARQRLHLLNFATLSLRHPMPHLSTKEDNFQFET